MKKITEKIEKIYLLSFQNRIENLRLSNPFDSKQNIVILVKALQ